MGKTPDIVNKAPTERAARARADAPHGPIVGARDITTQIDDEADMESLEGEEQQLDVQKKKEEDEEKIEADGNDKKKDDSATPRDIFPDNQEGVGFDIDGDAQNAPENQETK